jgi:hypothetical protein
MPPTFDAYAWVDARDQVAALSSFIDRYVDAEMPGDPRIYAFVRTFVSRDPDPGDAEALTELRQDDSAQASFSLYLRAKEHAGAIVTLTEEGAVVLGISLDDPENAPETAQTASALMALHSSRSSTPTAAGSGSVGLPPPQTQSEWMDDALVVLREGTV